MIPLVLTKEGERVKVSRVLGSKGLIRRMMDIGLRPGAEVEVISISRNGPVVIRLGGQRVGIGFGMAKKIFVDLII